METLVLLSFFNVSCRQESTAICLHVWYSSWYIMTAAPEVKVIFGQMVIGPPGSGKTTYCRRMAEILNELKRETVIINIDPANDVSLPYTPRLDVSTLIKTEDVMSSFKLGPNGALVYAMEYLEANIDWLIDGIKSLAGETYVIFDCPGQIELYTHSQSFRSLTQKLTKPKLCGFDLRLVSVYLVDSHACSDSGKFISCLLSSLSAMLHLELPHVNLLSKTDLMSKHDARFSLSYFCEVPDLNYLLDDLIDDPFLSKYKELTAALADTIQSYGLVSFEPLNINDNRTLLRIISLVDRANGYYLSKGDLTHVEGHMQNRMSM